jgi:hypothetical protein
MNRLPKILSLSFASFLLFDLSLSLTEAIDPPEESEASEEAEDEPSNAGVAQTDTHDRGGSNGGLFNSNTVRDGDPAFGRNYSTVNSPADYDPLPYSVEDNDNLNLEEEFYPDSDRKRKLREEHRNNPITQSEIKSLRAQIERTKGELQRTKIKLRDNNVTAEDLRELRAKVEELKIEKNKYIKWYKQEKNKNTNFNTHGYIKLQAEINKLEDKYNEEKEARKKAERRANNSYNEEFIDRLLRTNRELRNENAKYFWAKLERDTLKNEIERLRRRNSRNSTRQPDFNSYTDKYTNHSSDDEAPGSESVDSKPDMPLEDIMEDDELIQNEIDMHLSKLNTRHNKGFNSAPTSGISAGNDNWFSIEFWGKYTAGKKFTFTGDANSYKESSLGGFVSGIDFGFGKHFTLGVGSSFTGANKISQNTSLDGSNKFNISLYGDYHFGRNFPLYLRFSGTNSFAENEIYRGGLSLPVDTFSGQFKYEIGYDFNFRNLQLTPFYSIGAQHGRIDLNTQKLEERYGIDRSLASETSNYSKLINSVGINFKTIYRALDSLILMPTIRYSYTFFIEETPGFIASGSLAQNTFQHEDMDNLAFSRTTDNLYKDSFSKNFQTIALGVESKYNEYLNLDSMLSLKLQNSGDCIVSGSVKFSYKL